MKEEELFGHFRHTKVNLCYLLIHWVRKGEMLCPIHVGEGDKPLLSLLPPEWKSSALSTG